MRENEIIDEIKFEIVLGKSKLFEPCRASEFKKKVGKVRKVSLASEFADLRQGLLEAFWRDRDFWKVAIALESCCTERAGVRLSGSGICSFKQASCCASLKTAIKYSW